MNLKGHTYIDFKKPTYLDQALYFIINIQYESTYQQKKPIMYTQRAKTVDVIKKNYSYW